MPSSQQTSTEVANLALAHCGLSKPIANLGTDRSIEAQMCRTLYDTARRATIRGGRWLFSIKQVTPAVVANQPSPEWLYAYQYPSDAIKLFRFVSYRLTNDTRQSRIPYTIAQPVPVGLSTLATPPTSYAETSGQWIYTNWPGNSGSILGFPVILEYAFDNQNVAQWTDDFVMAFSMKLAWYIFPSLTSNDSETTRDKLELEYRGILSRAAADDANEEQRPQDPQSEFIRAREGDICSSSTYGIPWQATPSGFIVE